MEKIVTVLCFLIAVFLWMDRIFIILKNSESSTGETL